jgi:transposase
MAAANDGVGGTRRTWSLGERQRIVDEALAPGASVAAVARRHGLKRQSGFQMDTPFTRGVARPATRDGEGS